MEWLMSLEGEGAEQPVLTSHSSGQAPRAPLGDAGGPGHV